MIEQPVYVQWIDKHFGAIMDVLQRTAAHLGNTALEIVSRAIPLIVPIPNALGVYSAAIHALGWSNATALALALSVECIFFVMFEITLKLWDGYQEDAQYKAPLTAMCIVSGVCVVLVMWLVYSVESMAGGATVLAALPVLSACTSVGIGLLRWHNARQLHGRRVTRKATVTVASADTTTVTAPAITDDNTVSVDGKPAVKPTPVERRNILKRRVKKGQPTGDDIDSWSSEFGVSARTIFRDIEALTEVAKATNGAHA